MPARLLEVVGDQRFPALSRTVLATVHAWDLSALDTLFGRSERSQLFSRIALRSCLTSAKSLSTPTGSLPLP